MQEKFAEIRLEVSSGKDLAFSGRVAACGSSKRGGSTRWTEIRIYQTQDQRWVLEISGMSSREGEKNIVSAYPSDSPEELVERLHRPDEGGTPYLSTPAKEALRQLEENFPEITAFQAVQKI